MNIHELNTKAITSPAWVGLDDGEDTYKLDLNATLSTIQTGVSSAETDATDALDRATTLQSQMATAQGDIAHNQDDIADLQSDLSSLDTRTTASLNNLQSEVDAVEEDVADLKSGLRQDQTAFIECESGTYKDADGAVKSSSNKRIRNVRPVSVKGYDAIVIPDGYEAWIFRLDKNGTCISAVSSWKSGKVMFTDILTDATRYINFGIKNTATPNSDISSEIGTVENGLILIPTIATIKDDINSIKTYHNWFDPKANYVLRNNNDSASRYGITINSDGSVSCTKYNNDYGQVMIKSADASKKLLPGTYVLSARVTINENITETDRQIGLRVGFSNVIQWVTMKTERGGKVDTTEKVGWVSATFEIAEEEVFAFCIIPRKGITSATYPITFDQIMISNSDKLLPYSNKIDEAYDLTARELIEALGEILSNALTPTDIFNGEPYEGAYDWQTPVVNYGALFKGVENVESFAFFTDPHVMGFKGRNEPNMHEYIKKVSKVFRSIPCAFTVCGGDWLNNDTLADEACYRLGYIKALADNMLCGCKLVLGNHDTNYQGKADAESERYTGTLANETIASLMFYDTNTRKAYYSFDGIRSKCYVLDSGIEHSNMLAYDWEQVGWLAEKLAEDDPEHAIIFLHIILNSGNVQTNATNFASVVEAYNSHTSVTLNGETYNFTSCTGHVDLWVAGHTHVDSTGTLGGIPYIVTSTLSYNSDVPLIDLVLVDYDNNVVKTIRVGGTGDNRTINLS